MSPVIIVWLNILFRLPCPLQLIQWLFVFINRSDINGTVQHLTVIKVTPLWVNANADKMCRSDNVSTQDLCTLTWSERESVSFLLTERKGDFLMSHNCDNQEVETLPEAPDWSTLKEAIKMFKREGNKGMDSTDVAVSETIWLASIYQD